MALSLKEHDIQRAYFDWARLHPVARRAYAVPNAAKRSPRLAAMMIAEGLRKGVLDVHLPVASGRFHGLFIEFKAGDNKPTPEQQQEVDRLVQDGFAVIVSWDTESAIKATQQYLSGQLDTSLTILKKPLLSVTTTQKSRSQSPRSTTPAQSRTRRLTRTQSPG